MGCQKQFQRVGLPTRTTSLNALKGLVLRGLPRHPRATPPNEKPRSGGERGQCIGPRPARSRPDPRNQPPGRDVTVTDWRLYTADHRDIDGGGNQNAE